MANAIIPIGVANAISFFLFFSIEVINKNEKS